MRHRLLGSSWHCALTPKHLRRFSERRSLGERAFSSEADAFPQPLAPPLQVDVSCSASSSAAPRREGWPPPPPTPPQRFSGSGKVSAVNAASDIANDSSHGAVGAWLQPLPPPSLSVAGASLNAGTSTMAGFAVSRSDDEVDHCPGSMLFATGATDETSLSSSEVDHWSRPKPSSHSAHTANSSAAPCVREVEEGGGEDDFESASSLEAAEEFIEAMFKLKEHHRLFVSVGAEVDKHFQAIARIRGNKRPMKRQAMEEAQVANFLQRVDKLLARELARRPDADPLRHHLQDLLSVGQKHFELLHAHLCCDPADHDEQQDDEEEGDAHQTVVVTEAPRATETELRPLHEHRVLDVDVRWESTGTSVAPVTSRTILLSNLPVEATEADLRWSLKPCGNLRRLEICEEWLDWHSILAAGETESHRSSTDTPAKKHWVYSPRYALLEFEEESGQSTATRPSIRIFGILLQDWEEKAPSKKDGVVRREAVCRPAYPQPASVKRCLLLRGIPWRASPQDVLSECARQLSSQSSPCELVLTNCMAFQPLTALSVRAGVDAAMDVMAEPFDDFAALRPSASSKAAVLRFRCFEDAYVARQALQGLVIQGRPVSCGFPPWRPICCTVDSQGQELSDDVMVDMPLGWASARYSPSSVDPILRFGIRSLPAKDGLIIPD